MPKLNRRGFMGAVGGSVPLSSMAEELTEGAAQKNATVLRKYRLIYNDDGGGACVLEPPLTPRQFVSATLGQIAGTHVDALSWPIGMNGLYVMNYPTRLSEGEVVGDSLRAGTGVKLESAGGGATFAGSGRLSSKAMTL